MQVSQTVLMQMRTLEPEGQRPCLGHTKGRWQRQDLTQDLLVQRWNLVSLTLEPRSGLLPLAYSPLQPEALHHSLVHTGAVVPKLHDRSLSPHCPDNLSKDTGS